MILKKYEEVEKNEVQMEGVKGVSIQWLLGADSKAPNFYMRMLEVEPGGHTPHHTHPWEHEIFVVEGKGQLNREEDSLPMEPGTFALVLPGEKHQFENTGDTPFKFLCIIPPHGK